MKDEIRISRVKKLIKQRNALMKKVGQVDNRIDALLKKGSTVKKASKKTNRKKTAQKRAAKGTGTEAHPAPGSSPEQLDDFIFSRAPNA